MAISRQQAFVSLEQHLYNFQKLESNGFSIAFVAWVLLY